MALTDIKCRTTKPSEKTYKLSDAGGLYLSVNPNGSKLWHFKYRYDGREKKLSIGPYPLVTGKLPTITTHPHESGHPVSGKFIELVTDVFKIFEISASVEATSRKVKDIHKRRRMAQDQAAARVNECLSGKTTNSD